MGLPSGQILVKPGTTAIQTLWNPYLWNRCMDLHHSKFYGIVYIMQYYGLITFTSDF